MKNQLNKSGGFARIVPILVIATLVIAGTYIYKNYLTGLSSGSASATPNPLANEFPNTYDSVLAMSEKFGLEIARKIGGQFEGDLRNVTNVEQKDHGDKTRTSNKGSSAHAFAWRQDGCIYRSFQLSLNNASTNSSSGKSTYSVANIYVYQWDQCTSTNTWSYGFFSLDDASSHAKFTTNETSSAELVLKKTPVTMISSNGQAQNVTISGDCALVGKGFTNTSKYLNHLSYEHYESTDKNDNAWRSGRISCKGNAISINGKNYPITPGQSSGYLNTYSWLRLTLNR